MDSRPLIKDSLQILSFISLNPLSTNIMNLFYGKCAAMIVMVTLADVWLYLSFNYQGIDSTMEVLLVVGISQNAIKMLFLLTYRKRLMLLINKISMFWKPKFYELEQQKENNKIFLYVKFSIQFYTALLLIIVLLYFIKPLFITDDVELPWKTCFSKLFGYRICYMLQIFQAPTCCLGLLGFDTLYVSLITNIICEFKLLENNFPNLKIDPSVRGTDKEVMTELKNLIDHHILILECVRIMKYVYRTPMLGLFSLNMFGMCFSLIIMTSSTSNNATKVLFGMVAIFYIIQLSFYCICGSMLADESVKISVQAYKSKWWIKTQPELRKTLMMVIRRANKPEMLTAGGLFQVNLQTFRMILRSTASFFTFMQVIYGNS